MSKALSLRHFRSEHGILTRIVVYLVFISFAAITILPFVWMAYSSFKTNGEILLDSLSLPLNPTLENYPSAWSVGGLGPKFLNTLFYSIGTTSLTVIFSLLAGFAFSKLALKRINAVLYNMFVIGMLISIQAILVPLFVMETRLGLQDTRLGLLLPYIAFSLPTGIYLATEFIRGIPISIIESARMDGATYTRIFTDIILGMTKPVIVTISIMTILNVWNEFILAFVLAARESIKSLPIGIFMFSGGMSVQLGQQMAALVIGTFPMILFYIGFHKTITQGVVAGSIKG